MKKIIFVIMAIIVFNLVSCKNDDPTKVINDQFYGITQTTETGLIKSKDSTDWNPTPKYINGKLDSSIVIYSYPASPNPFTDCINITFLLSVDAYYKITIYDKPQHILKQFPTQESLKGELSILLSSDSLFTKEGIYRVVIDAWSLDYSKHNETYGDIEYKLK